MHDAVYNTLPVGLATRLNVEGLWSWRKMFGVTPFLGIIYRLYLKWNFKQDAVFFILF
jgi:hypothetical protein